jgi:hypothetical protein
LIEQGFSKFVANHVSLLSCVLSQHGRFCLAGAAIALNIL